MIRAIILVSITVSFGLSVIAWRRQPGALRIISIFLGLNMVSEFVAFFLARRYHNNLAVFHLLSPLLLVVLSLYFTRISESVKKYKAGYIVCAIAVAFSIFNTVVLQPLHTLNSNYLLLQGLCVCVWGFIALYDFEKEDDLRYLNKDPNFWISLILIAQQVGTYLLYIIIEFFELQRLNPNNIRTVYTLLWMIGVLSYLSIGMVFVLLPIKKIKPHE